jgi:methyl-accepting chemotaxis protein
MIIYFLLIGVASLFVSVEFIIDTQRPALKQELAGNFQAYTQGTLAYDQIFTPIDRIRHKAVLTIAIIMFVLLIVLTMFVKNISEPLQHMIDTAREISGGDLRRTVKISSRNELAELGQVINDLASNLQEAVLLSRNISTAGAAAIDSLGGLLAADSIEPSLRAMADCNLEQLRLEIAQLQELIGYFHFYSGEEQ